MGRKARAVIARGTSFALAAVLLLNAPACILPAGGGRRTGVGVSRGDASAVVRGRLTKAELFDRLGPPMAIVSRGEYAHVPAENVHHVDDLGHRTISFGGASWVQQADAWFEPFAARRPLREAHRVYYWYATSESGVSFFLLVGGTVRWSSRAELWVLVDEETGLAEDAGFLGR